MGTRVQTAAEIRENLAEQLDWRFAERDDEAAPVDRAALADQRAAHARNDLAAFAAGHQEVVLKPLGSRVVALWQGVLNEEGVEQLASGGLNQSRTIRRIEGENFYATYNFLL